MLFSSPFRLLCGVGLAAIFSSTLSKSPVLPLFAAHLGATAADVGYIAAASTTVGILVSLPAGILSDLWGRRRVILLAMAVFASAPFLYLLVDGVQTLVAVRLYHGLATAVFGPVALALVADSFSMERGEKMGWYSSATLLGRSAAPLAGGAILGAFALQAADGYRLVYLACGGSGLLALLLALRLPIRTNQPAEDAPDLGREWQDTKKGLREVLSHTGILCTSATEAVQYLAYGAVETFLPLYALRIGLNAYQIGLLLGVQVVVLTLSKPFMGRLSDRRGRRGQIVLGLLAGAAGLVLLPFTASLWGLLPISLALGLSMATVTAATAALVSDLARTRSLGAALGTMSAIMDIGHALGPVTAGLLISAHGYRNGFAVIGVLLAAAGLLFPLVVRTGRAAP